MHALIKQNVAHRQKLKLQLKGMDDKYTNMVAMFRGLQARLLEQMDTFKTSMKCYQMYEDQLDEHYFSTFRC